MALPTFIVIGVAKAGTTSIYRYLDQHPQIFMCPDKGTNFFGYEDARDWKWTDEGEPPLLRHFRVKTLEDYKSSFAGVSNEPAVGEVSPQYFRCPGAAQRIRDCIPEAKLIASLRNPADRAFSGFLMRIRRGESVKSAYEDLTPSASHVREGFYFQRMKRYFDVFPRTQIKVYLFDEFKQDPTRVMVDLFRFLGVDATFVPDTSPQYNPANIPKSRVLNRLFYHPALIRTSKSLLPVGAHGLAKRVRALNLKPPPKLPADLRAELLELYRDDILRLETLLGQDLSIWLEGSSEASGARTRQGSPA
jgi:sulfotransferase family protein